MVNEELRELLDDFLLEAEERLSRIEVTLLTVVDADAGERRSAFKDVRRELHTLKGNSGMMGFSGLQKLAHELEDLVDGLDLESLDLEPLLSGLDRFKRDLAAETDPRGPAPEAGEETAAAERPETASKRERRDSSTRVRLDRLDRLLETSTRLIVGRNDLKDKIAHGVDLAPSASDFPEASLAAWRAAEEAERKLDQVLDLLQDQIRDLRTVPLKSVFERLQRVVHDEGRRAGKEVSYESRGGETPLDTALTELAIDVLGHLIRNSIVHGLEKPDERERVGKPRQGIVFLEASLRGGDVEIEVFDDGTGIEEEKLRRAARKAGIEEADSADLHALLFHPGLSTRETADRSAGRGMGLSAVLAAVHRHGGTIAVDTSVGLGTRFGLKLPLTVAVTEALLVTSGGERFALPIAAVQDTGRRASLDRDALDLKDFLDLPLGGRRSEFFVTVEAEGRTSTIAVDELGSIQRIVVNPLDELFGRPKGIAGSTVLGDGRVVLILDPPQLAASQALESGAHASDVR